MKIFEIGDNIIDFEFYKKKKALQDVPNKISNAILGQQEIEKVVRNKLKQLQMKSAGWNAKFRIPTILTDYQKGIYPMDAWGFEIFLAMSGERDERIAKFIIEKATEYLPELIRISEEDIKNAESLISMADDSVAPEHVKQIIYGKSGSYRNNLGTFKKFRNLLKQGKTSWNV